jgi:MFS transporter, ACS family, glucarate transporter
MGPVRAGHAGFGRGHGLCTIAVMFTHSPTVALAFLSLTYGAITLQQPIMFAVCLDIGGLYAGAMVGAMNMASQLGGFLGSLAFGYLVAHTGSYNVAFLPMAALLLLGTWLWFRIDPTEPLTAATAPTGLAASLTAQAD